MSSPGDFQEAGGSYTVTVQAACIGLRSSCAFGPPSHPGISVAGHFFEGQVGIVSRFPQKGGDVFCLPFPVVQWIVELAR